MRGGDYTLLKEDIELVIVLPFLGHSAKWDIRSKRRLDYLLKSSILFCIERLYSIKSNFYLLHHEMIAAQRIDLFCFFYLSHPFCFF